MRKRRRVTPDQVRKNAVDGGGGSRWYSLPADVRDWFPDKPGTVMIDIVPYEVTDDNHPDGIEKGSVWYMRTFRVHYSEGQSIVCPKSVDKNAFCPWCKEFLKLRKQGADDEVLRPFQGQMMVAFNILDPADKDKIAVFVMSYGKFAKTLKEELEQADESDLLFFDVKKGCGRTLKTRFVEKKFGGKKFIQANKIDFKPRKSMDEEEIFKKVVNLDTFLRVLPPEKIKKIFLQSDDEEDDREKEAKELKRKKAAKKAKELGEKHPSPLRGDADESPKEKLEKALKKKGKKCPIKGGVFGRDVDKFKKCATCPLYEACEAASG